MWLEVEKIFYWAGIKWQIYVSNFEPWPLNLSALKTLSSLLIKKMSNVFDKSWEPAVSLTVSLFVSVTKLPTYLPTYQPIRLQIYLEYEFSSIPDHTNLQFYQMFPSTPLNAYAYMTSMLAHCSCFSTKLPTSQPNHPTYQQAIQPTNKPSNLPSYQPNSLSTN